MFKEVTEVKCERRQPPLKELGCLLTMECVRLARSRGNRTGWKLERSDLVTLELTTKLEVAVVRSGWNEGNFVKRGGRGRWPRGSRVVDTDLSNFVEGCRWERPSLTCPSKVTTAV
ncbi:MAG: hypothetical protein ACTS43_01125 [Candidatus Hodgkinia cicadicola]